MRRITITPLYVLLLGCSSSSPPPTLETDLGGLAVRLWSSPARLQVSDPDGRIVFDGLLGGPVAEGSPPLVAAAVRHADVAWDTGFGTFRPRETAEPWNGVARFDDPRLAGDTVRFDLRAEDGATLGSAELSSPAPGELLLVLRAADPRHNRVSLGFACTPDEHFLGLGGQSWDVDHRGRTVPLWVQEDGIGKDETDDYQGLWYIVGRRHQTHTPIPIALSSRPAGLLLDTSRYALFDFCSTDPARGRLEAWEGELRLHLFAGEDPARVLRRVSDRVGRPDLPPAFAFAPWLDALYGSDNVRRVARKLRDLDIPSSVIWTEDWRGGNEGPDAYSLDEDWRVDRDLYPDFETLADDLHALGFKFLTYNNTFVVRDADVWDEVTTAGHAIRTPAGDPYTFLGVTFADTTLIDLSNPAAVAFTKDVYRQGLLQGADGWMADYAEWLPTDCVLHSGADPEAFHNLYPVEFQRLNRELLAEQHALDGVERLFFARSGWLGSQPLVSVFWAGDQQTDFSPGDGLPSVIPMGLGLGIAGFPYFAHDIGGYQSGLTEPTTRELWYRWVTLGALSPVMRTHHGRSARQNWNWESDAASTEHFRRWAVLHMRLFPYLYRLAEIAHDTGLPILRPLALRWPAWEPGWTATDQFLLGDRIVVAPVVTEGAASRDVRLPPGTFFPLLGGPPLTAGPDGATFTVPAPLEELPAFVPAGSLLVLLPEGVDTAVAEPDTDEAVVTVADAGDDRELWVWPGGEGATSEWTEVGGRLSYRLDGGPIDVLPAAADWNGTPVPFVERAVTVTGPGTLTVGPVTVTLVGGSPDRTVVLRFP